MPLRPDMEFQDYLNIFLKRKWIVILSFLFVLFGAGVYTVVTPVQFKSTTTILVIPQHVPQNYIQSTVTQEVEGRLATIQQQVTSRTMLLKVMSELGLFSQAQKEQTQEDVIEMMAKRVEIDVAQNRRREGERTPGSQVFSISFLHEDPKLAMLTATRLASLFIEENQKSRSRQAVGTSELLDSHLRGTKAKLEAQEDRVRQYKLRYSGELPQELQTNISALTRLQQQYSTSTSEISTAESKRLMLQSQLAAIERGPQAIVHDDGRAEVDTSAQATEALATQLTTRRGQLAELSAKYTERHPDVIRLRHEVEELEKRLAEAPSSVRTSNEPRGKASVSTSYVPLAGKDREEFRRLKQQIASTDAEIVALRAQRAGIQGKIAAYQAKVDQAPSHEQELISLTRDYENLKRSYDDLLKKKLDADMSQTLETRHQGDQFQILDPANLPEKPFKPNRMTVAAFSLLMASVLGFGGAIGLEKMDLSLRGVTDFKLFFDIPILACIPVLENSDADRRHKFRRKAILAGVISFAFCIFAFLLVFGQKIRDILNH